MVIVGVVCALVKFRMLGARARAANGYLIETAAGLRLLPAPGKLINGELEINQRMSVF